MENASKALVMAASVLIGIILLSIMVYMFVNFAVTSAEIHKENDQNQLNQFNSQFTSYVGKEGLTIYDVVTVANLATESNIYYEFPKIASDPSGDNNYIKVKLVNSNLTGYHNQGIERGYVKSRTIDVKQEISNYYNKLIKLALDKDIGGNSLREYNCEVKISDVTGRVYFVTFKAK